MVANIIYSDRLNAIWVKCHLVAFNPGGIYQGNLLPLPLTAKLYGIRFVDQYK